MQLITQPHHTGARRIDDPVIATHGLSKDFGKRRAVDQIDVTVQRRRITGLLGPNGSGKSTTLRMLLGLIAPTAGTATVLGESIAHPSRYLGRVGALVEAPVHDPALTARRLLTSLALSGGHPLHSVADALESVGLADRADDRVDDFSLGMRQRVGLAAALLPDPELLVLDEPTNGLDPAGIVEIRGLLRRQVDHGRTVLVSSHLLSEMEDLCDDVIVLSAGQLLYQGGLDELRSRYPAHRQWIEVRPSLEQIFLDMTSNTIPESSEGLS